MVPKLSATLRAGKPAIVTQALALWLFFFSSHALAATDLAVGTTVRSYPLSGVVEAEGGYNFLLWGATGSPWYGYLRPRVDGSSAVTYNSMGAAVQFYPVSFLGVTTGAEGIQNDEDYSAYNCKTANCRGRFYRNYVQAELSLGAGPVFFQGRWRRERWTQTTSTSMSFVEPTNGLALASAGDSETVYRALLGWKLDGGWSVAGVVVYAESDIGQGSSRFPFMLVRYTRGPLSVGVGGGVFSSSLKGESGSVLAFLRWEVMPSLALQ